MCWISPSSSMAVDPVSLHLIEHRREEGLELERLLDLVGCHVRILAVLQEARALMLPGELDEGRRIGLPVGGEALEVLEHGVDAILREERDGVLGVLVEV